MTKIQIIIDDDKSLKAYTCNEVNMISPELELDEYCGVHLSPHIRKLRFEASTLIVDETPQLVSLPDELLLRIRDYNINTEHQNTLQQTLKLREMIEKLKQEISNYKDSLLYLQDDVKLYHKVLDEIVDEYPKVAAQVALKLGQLDVACWLASQENKTEEEEN